MIALRYGAVPLVRRTGGLADTVFDVDGPAGGPAQPRNGFVFDGSDDGALHGALDRALTLYTTQPERWAALQQDNMRLDVRWAESQGGGLMWAWCVWMYYAAFCVHAKCLRGHDGKKQYDVLGFDAARVACIQCLISALCNCLRTCALLLCSWGKSAKSYVDVYRSISA